MGLVIQLYSSYIAEWLTGLALYVRAVDYNPVHKHLFSDPTTEGVRTLTNTNFDTLCYCSLTLIIVFPFTL